MYCTQCGTLATTSEKFCAKCGNPVSMIPPEKTVEAPAAVPVVVKKPRALWLYIVGFCIFGTAAAMFIPVFAGLNVPPQSVLASTFWTGLFFYLWWKRRARKGWHGLLIGFAIGFFVFFVAVSISVIMQRANAESYYRLGYAHIQAGRYQEAVAASKQAIKFKPDLADAHSILGTAYANLGRYQEAMEASKQAIKLKPDLAEPHYNLGLVYFFLRRPQEAGESLKEAIRLKADFAPAHFFLGCGYYQLGDKGNALEEYKILKTLDPEMANKLFNLIYK